MRKRFRPTKSADAQHWRPTRRQELLLRAALCRGEEALDAWRRWQSTADLSRLDAGSARLLPLLYHNLRLHDVDDPLAERLKEEYLRAWYDNELLFHAAADLLRSFRAGGIETVVLKGAPLALLFYGDAGLRPMSDVDILVRPRHAKLAIRIMREAGWKSAYDEPEALVPYEHAVEFHDGRGFRCDLHWRVLWDGRQQVGDEDFWEGAVRFEINGAPTAALNAADQLLHVCAHGVVWSETPSLRWVADAVVVLRAAEGEFDWDRLVAQVRKRRLMLPLADTLGYLRELLRVQVPQGVLTDICNMPATRTERALYRIRTGRGKALKSLPVLHYWFNAWRLARDSAPPHRVLDFLKYLKCLWGLAHLWQTPFYVAIKSVRGVARIVSGSLSQERRS